MTQPLLWLPDVLLDAGLKVAEVPGWQTRGRPAGFRDPFGVLCHHTAGPKHGNMPSLGLLISGRQHLPGPLSQLGLGRDGTYYVIAAGRANHAGSGIWAGVTEGNAHFIGIEAENTGLGEPWPDIQMAAYQRGVAAILQHLKLDADRCAGHAEYALPKGRKADPSFDMHSFRAAVAQILAGNAPALAPIPSAEPASPNRRSRPTLRRGAQGEDVKALQISLRNVPVTGVFDALVEAAVRALQREHQLVPDGIVGPKSWALLDRLQVQAA